MTLRSKRAVSMTRRDFLKTAAAGGLAAGTGAGCGAGNRIPNIILIFPDQLRAQALRMMGNTAIHTPQLDHMAEEGILIENMFANSPDCSPARACMFTGKYAHANGVTANDLRLREDETTLAELFAEEGYMTGFIGKWHLDGGPRMPGFVPPGQRRQGFVFWAANECNHDHYDSSFFMDSPEPIPIAGFEANEWADIAIDFLSVVQGMPFFLTIAMGPPHDPYYAPDQFAAMYRPETLPIRPNWVRHVENGGRDDLAEYYGMISSVDYEIGRILHTLHEYRMDDNTIVIVTSDHGDMLGSHGLAFRGQPYEESVHVPGIVRWPDHIAAGSRSNAIMTHADLAPTILGLCGIDAPGGMQGRDLSRLLLGRTDDAPDSAFLQMFGPGGSSGAPAGWRGVRTGTHLYATFRDMPWLLFDMERDPYQMTNLAADPSYAPIRNQLHALVMDWMSRTGDSWDNDWSFPIEDSGELHRHQAFHSVAEYLAWAREHPEEVPPHYRGLL